VAGDAVVGEEDLDRLSEQLRRRIAEDLGGDRVGVRDRAVGVDDEDGVGSGVEERAEGVLVEGRDGEGVAHGAFPLSLMTGRVSGRSLRAAVTALPTAGA
jgi:hypothetical protein